MANSAKFGKDEIIELVDEDGNISEYRLLGVEDRKEESAYPYLKLEDAEGNESVVNFIDVTELRGAGKVMVIEIIDEDGVHISCSLGDITEYKGKLYIFLFIDEPEEDLVDGNSILLELSVENDEMIFNTLEPDFMDEVHKAYLEEVGYEEDLYD